MKEKNVSFVIILALITSLLAACVPAASSSTQPAATAEMGTSTTITETVVSTPQNSVIDTTKDDVYAEALTFNNTAWQYDTDNNVYWQNGLVYCATPEIKDYESLGIYVPGDYVNASDNGDGTYTLSINNSGSINGYTAKTAPIVMPVNTPGYSAQKAPNAYNYNDISSYLKAGFVYVIAGMRGRNNGYDDAGKLIYSGGAPWGVTDFKAAVRYLRYNKDLLPGDTASIFVFGHSGGGAQSSIIGASGDSDLYTPYLESIGAALYDANGNYISDAVRGVMAWCPITSLDYADEAYEWNMGQYASTGTRADGTWTSALSKDLAAAYAEYINRLGLTDPEGQDLTLEKTDNGVYASGSYYDLLKSVVEQSLNNFLFDTTFPYTQTAGGGPGGMPPGGPAGNMPQGRPAGAPPAGDTPAGGPAGTPRSGSGTSSQAVPTTYDTTQDYIHSLNSDETWVTYNAESNTATISSIEAFARYIKKATKNVTAFDDLDRGQAENFVFGNDDSDALHFDKVLTDLLKKNQTAYGAYSDWNASVVDTYAADLKAVDKLGSNLETRQNMYNPMYYLVKYYSGYQTSTVAPYWRIHTGIEQGDTATTVEMNLALALENLNSVESVDFETVWNQGHTMAERSGDSMENFITWVNDSVK
jgi:hypothetical protein